MNAIAEMIEEQLLRLRTVFLGKVLSCSGATANIQPLSMVKALGEAAEKPAPLTGVPVMQQAQYKLSVKDLTYLVTVSSTHTERNVVTAEPLAAGDVVVCVCADRDITEARKGSLAVPSVRHHDLSDAIVIGVIA